MYAVALLSYFTCLLFLICSLTGAARLCSSLSHQFTRCYGKPNSSEETFTAKTLHLKKLKIKISAPFWFDWTVSAASRGCRLSWWNNEMFLVLFFVLYEPLKVIYSRNRALAVCSHFGIALVCCCWLWSFCKSWFAPFVGIFGTSYIHFLLFSSYPRSGSQGCWSLFY